MILRKRSFENVKVARLLGTTSNTTAFPFVEVPNHRADIPFNRNRKPLKIKRKAFLESKYCYLAFPRPLEQALGLCRILAKM